MNNKKLELTWYGKDKKINLEPRILIEDKKLSNVVNGETENMLIHGDNLLVLKALEQYFAGKIKCIYIDPPFNTGAAFEHYDDNLEHSIWLDLMYRRLIILHKLLTDDGVLLIQIDDNEMPYLRVVLDEIFGRGRFVAQINVKSNNLSGTKTAHKEKTVLRNKDNIIIYKKKDEIKIIPQYVERTRWDTHYNMFAVFENDKLIGFEKFKNVLIKRGIIGKTETIKEEILKNDIFYKFIIENKDKICRLVNSMPADMRKESKEKPNTIIQYLDDNGKTRYAYNGNRVSFLESSILNIDGEEKFVQLLGDLWVDIDFQNTQNEGGVSFPASKKPEALIRRILNMFTVEGDIVLDSFLGSGTTASVAHKMKRKWIGIEMGDHAYTHCKTRIDNIISGKDNSGITRAVSWQGGGGYKFYELAPTLIEEDAFGQKIINPSYNATMLASAIAKHEGYNYNPDGNCYWKQSKNNNSFLYVTTQHITSSVIESIKTELKDDEFLLVVCKSFDSNCNLGNKNINIKKIPQSLLKNCEFGVDNYNLNIINSPVYEEEEEEDE